MTFEPATDDSQPEPSNEQKQAIYVAKRAIVRAASEQAETVRKAQQAAAEQAKPIESGE